MPSEKGTQKGYTIKFPSTTRDDGSPSDDILHDCRRILLFIDDERHLIAQKLYASVTARLQEHPGRNPKPLKFHPGNVLKRKKLKKVADSQGEDYITILEYLEAHRETLETMEKKAELFKRARNELQKNDAWVLSQTLFGVTTYYRKEGDGSLSLKMEGRLEGVPLFDQVAVIREIDLHHTWAPFCTSSLTLKELDKCDTVGWFVMGVPQLGLARDGIFRAVGCDNLAEDNTFLIVGQGLHDRPDSLPYAEPYLTEGLEGIDFPDKPSRIGSGRMTLRHFSASIDVVSPTCCETKLVANIDPNLPLPQSLLDFITRKMCGIVFHKLQRAANKIAKDPVKNPHAQRMRQAKEFYEGWLLPKFQAYSELKNWTMPKVSALELSEEDQEKEFEFIMSHQHKVKAPHASRQEDDESTSSVSRLTIASTITRNPVSRYLREMEAKTQAKKALRISSARQRAANRLKPKHLSEEQLLRLEELKDAKARRQLVIGTEHSLTDENQVEKLPIISSLHDHTTVTRVLTITTLCCLMTVVFNPNIIALDLLDTFSGHSESLWLTILIDIIAIAYICCCAMIHFAVCDVAMVYAFGALDIGMKTGRQSKKYYSDSVQIVVAVMSAFIAAFGIGKALGDVLIRTMVWHSMRGIRSSQALLENWQGGIGSHIPSIVVDVAGNGIGVFNFVVSNVWLMIKCFTYIFYTGVIDSNPVGKLVEVIATIVVKAIPSLSYHWETYLAHVYDVYEGTTAAPSWRIDAIETTKFLLTYTAVFLLTILVLFNASSRGNKRKNEEWDALANSVPLSNLKEKRSTEIVENRNSSGVPEPQMNNSSSPLKVRPSLRAGQPSVRSAPTSEVVVPHK